MGVDLSRVENARFLDRSQKRIFDTNVRQAYGFSEWKQGMMPGGAASGKFVYLSVPLTESERCLLTSSDQSCWHSLVRFFWHLGQLRNSCTAHSPMSRSQRREAALPAPRHAVFMPWGCCDPTPVNQWKVRTLEGELLNRKIHEKIFAKS